MTSLYNDTNSNIIVSYWDDNIDGLNTLHYIYCDPHTTITLSEYVTKDTFDIDAEDHHRICICSNTPFATGSYISISDNNYIMTKEESIYTLTRK